MVEHSDVESTDEFREPIGKEIDQIFQMTMERRPTDERIQWELCQPVSCGDSYVEIARNPITQMTLLCRLKMIEGMPHVEIFSRRQEETKVASASEMELVRNTDVLQGALTAHLTTWMKSEWTSGLQFLRVAIQSAPALGATRPSNEQELENLGANLAMEFLVSFMPRLQEIMDNIVSILSTMEDPTKTQIMSRILLPDGPDFLLRALTKSYITCVQDMVKGALDPSNS